MLAGGSGINFEDRGDHETQGVHPARGECSVHVGDRGPFMTPEEFPAVFGQGWALPKPQPFLDHFLP
jgi:hypothetical protein